MRIDLKGISFVGQLIYNPWKSLLKKSAKAVQEKHFELSYEL